MKHSGIILATVGMLILCVLTLSLISMPGKSPAPSSPPAAQPPLKMLVGDAPRNTQASAENPAAAPQPASTAPEAAGVQPAQVEGGVVTGPDGCVLLGCPDRLTYLAEYGLTLMSNWSGVFAFKTDSGELAWYRYNVSRQGCRGFSFGRHHVLLWSEEEFHVLDAATGRETWSQNNAPYGHIRWARLSPDESRFVACGERDLVFYSLTGSERRRLSRPQGIRGGSWFGDGKTYLVCEPLAEEGQVRGQWSLIDADSGERLSGWETARPWGIISGISGQGRIAVLNYAEEKDPTLKILDARTGTEVHAFQLPERPSYVAWSSDGRWLVFASQDTRRMFLANAETGNVESSLPKEGHRFCSPQMLQDTHDLDWVLSQDALNNWHAWPVTPDGTPRMILSSRGVAAGPYSLTKSPTNCILMNWHLTEQVWVHVALALEDQRKLAEWRVRDNEQWFFDCIVNQNLTRLARSRLVDPQKQGWAPKDLAYSVYTRNGEAPLFSGQGRPVDMSPDGRYIVAQTTENAASLYDLDTGLLAEEYHSPDDRAYYAVTFSDDSRRMAMHGTKSIEVTELIEGYPRQTLGLKEENRLGWRPIFSPDGLRVLCGGARGAWLFDAETGALLQTFEETERFAQRYAGGFWNGLAARAGDWMGSVSDRFKSGAYVEAAFAEHGTRVVTYAAGQVIRVWDAESGSLLRTIHTGLPEQRNKTGNIRNEISLSPNGCFAFSYNLDGDGVASLWSLSDGAVLRQYRLPDWEDAWPQAIILDDASEFYISYAGNVYRWPGILAGSSHAVVEETGRE